jgi:hypothetical protein
MDIFHASEGYPRTAGVQRKSRLEGKSAILAFDWKIHELNNLRCEEGLNTGEVGNSGNTITVAEGNRSRDRFVEL